MSSQRSILLGLFFLVTLSVLGYYTLFLTDFTLFKKQPELRVYFSETNGLREGDSVLVAGMRWGRVKKMIYDPTASGDRRITIIAALNEPLTLREGSTIQIKDATLLGGRNVTIEPGPPDQPELPPGQPLMGMVAPSPIDAIGNLISSSEKGINQVVADLQVITRGMRDGKGAVGKLLVDEKLGNDLAEVVSGAAKAIENLRLITADLQAGRGSAGQLLKNDELFAGLTSATRKLNDTLEAALLLARDARTGEGVIPQLIADGTLVDQVRATLADIHAITNKINEGNGLVATLLNDDSIPKNVSKIVTAIANGEGTIGALLVKPEVYDNLRLISEDVAVMTGAVRNGQGSIGKLVMDDEIYKQLRTALQIMQRSLEEYREAAPITTFTTVFFGAL